MRRVSLAFSTPMLWAVGCLAVLAMALMTSAAVSAIIVNAHLFAKNSLQDTYFVVPHFHYALWQAAAFGVFAGWYHFFPKVTGYSCSERLARIHFWLSMAGVGALNLIEIVVPAQLFLFDLDAGMLPYWSLVSSIGACVLAAGLLVFLANTALSFVRRRPAR